MHIYKFVRFWERDTANNYYGSRCLHEIIGSWIHTVWAYNVQMLVSVQMHNRVHNVLLLSSVHARNVLMLSSV